MIPAAIPEDATLLSEKEAAEATPPESKKLRYVPMCPACIPHFEDVQKLGNAMVF